MSLESLPWYTADAGWQPSRVADVQATYRAAVDAGTVLALSAQPAPGKLCLAGLNQTRAYDRESCVVEVEAGATFGQMRAYVESRGGSTHNLRREHPKQTIGTLLAERKPLGHVLWNGSLREATLGLSAVTDTGELYRYTPAPRKASGPDLRYLYMGCEGANGAIVSAELVVRPGRPHTEAFEVVCADLAEVMRLIQSLFFHGFRAPNLVVSGAEATLWVLLEGATFEVALMRARLQKHVDGMGLRMESMPAENYYEPTRDGDVRRGADPIVGRSSEGQDVVELVGSPADFAKMKVAWQKKIVVYDVSGHQCSAYIPRGLVTQKASSRVLYWDGDAVCGGEA